ncbi:MAG: radical SAM family heme chaperone HemW [Phycisphaerales bacterium]|nr:radical SAM family heme chaperone HemW [Phycisphaerales bacterium]
MELPQAASQCTDAAQSTPGILEAGIGSLVAPQNHVDSVYLHVPFCRHRCHYCDFFTLAGRNDEIPRYVDRVVDELCVSASRFLKPVQTVFFGGGTPTLLPPEQLRRLVQAFHDSVPMAQGVEWTVEANPETVTAEHASVLAAGGVNRISLGAQSFDVELLRTLERRHDPSNVLRSIEHVRGAGIDRISVDLIYAIPGQTLEQWSTDLQRAIDLGVTHLSCYGLVYEHGTPMTRRRDQGHIAPIDETLESEMHLMAREVLAGSGFQQYEISNWSHPNQQCMHNLVYWRNGNWWPVGPGASGHIDGVRWKNEARLGTYVSGAGLPAATHVEQVDADAQVGEAFMMGLRLMQGMSAERVESLLACGRDGERRRRMIELHAGNGLLEMDSAGLRLTEAGILLSDTVFADLL